MPIIQEDALIQFLIDRILNRIVFFLLELFEFPTEFGWFPKFNIDTTEILSWFKRMKASALAYWR